MKRHWSLRTGLLALLAAAVTACADTQSPLEPTAEEPQFARVAASALPVVEWNRSMGRRSATAVIGPEGGTLSVGPVRFTVPAGALAAPTRITMVVPGGKQARVMFAPHGLQFRVPARLSFGYDHTAASAAGWEPSDLVGVYFRGSVWNGRVDPLQLFEVTVDDGVVEFDVPHFSAYALAKG